MGRYADYPEPEECRDCKSKYEEGNIEIIFKDRHVCYREVGYDMARAFSQHLEKILFYDLDPNDDY